MVFYIIFLFPYQIANSSFVLDEEKYAKEIEKYNKQKQEVVVKKIIQCESEGKHDVWGDKNYIYPAYGILQFQQRTFYWLSSISGKKNLKWKNKDHQIELLKWALQNGQGELWTCYRILSKKGEI